MVFLCVWQLSRRCYNNSMIEIVLNGESATMPEETTVRGLLQQMQLTEQRIAVEVNREIVPRSLHADHKLSAGDQVEIVQAIGGG